MALVASAGVAALTPAAAAAQVKNFNIPAQSASNGIAALARQADVQILISAEHAAHRRTRRVVGTYTIEQALGILTSGTGLYVKQTGPNAYSVIPFTKRLSTSNAADNAQGIPDILVTGRRNWSLNSGIERTRDDTQPFVVFSAEDIKRSGATNVEQFLSNYLPSNAAAGTSEQATGTLPLQGRSSVDLRGLGKRETLILVDGRRQAGVNSGSGDLEQPLITNIPIAAIERIEVLASSAAGIYGAGATGGVINIVLRRDYHGRQLTLNYADTTDFKARDSRADLVVGQTLEGGRTNISFTASYRNANPLTQHERQALIEGAERAVLANNPAFFARPPLGSTPNILSSTPLRLKAQYGGTLLGSNYTYVPIGYRGVALDGVAPLVANAGKFNLNTGDTVGESGSGGLVPIVYGTKLIAGTFAARREMTSWLRMYGEVDWSRYNSTSLINLAGSVFTLPASAPNNPFQQSITVAAPISGQVVSYDSHNDQLKLIGGAIVRLPYDWQAVVDASFSRNWFRFPKTLTGIDTVSRTALSNGTYDILQDTAQTSFPLSRYQATLPNQSNESSQRDISLKLAGKLPFSLPGGKPTLTLNGEETHQGFSPVYGVSQTSTLGSITYTPERDETIDSLYGELRIPVLDGHQLPLVQRLEFTVAVRHEWYKGAGSGIGYSCLRQVGGFAAGDVSLDLCNPANIALPRVSIANSHTDPTFGVRWQVAPDLTFRASYATGYLPPKLNQLIRQPATSIVVYAVDPQRGGEPLGRQIGGGVGLLSGFNGGNPDLQNESSKSFTGGAILTPRFLPGLRFSLDYTLIRKRQNIADPSALLITYGTAEGQAAFENFLALFPDRVTRGAASSGFAVGPITTVDVSQINLGGTLFEALDFALTYARPLFGGRIDVQSDATYSIRSELQVYPGGPFTDFSGVVSTSGEANSVSFGAGVLRWRGVGSVRWSNDRWSIGWRGRYFDGYYLNVAHTVSTNNGTNRVPSQFYQDIFGTYRIDKTVDLRGGVSNFLDRKPPYVSGDYSHYGDPRLANFYLTLTKQF